MHQPVTSVSMGRFLLKRWRALVLGGVGIVLTVMLRETTERNFDPSTLDGPIATAIAAAKAFSSLVLSPVPVPLWLAVLVLAALGGVIGWLVLQLRKKSRLLVQAQAQLAESQNPSIPSLNDDQLTVLKTICDFMEIRVRADDFTLPGTTHLSLLRVSAALNVLEQHKLIWDIAGRFELTKAGRAYLMNPAVKCDYARL